MKRLNALVPSFSIADLAAYAFVFIVYFAFADASLYVYYTYQTSPALIWPPVGIAIVAMILGGYRMWLPIFLAQFLATLMFVQGVYLIPFIIAAGFAVQAVVALYILDRFGFTRTLDSMRNVLILVGVVIFATLIEPIIATAAQLALGTLMVSPIVNLGRAWGAGIFSALIIVPLIVSWYPWKKFSYARRHLVEIILAFALLIATDIFLFWTTFTQFFGIAVIFFLPAVLIWFALRFEMRWFTLALALTSVIGIAGAFATKSADQLSTQLIASEIYIAFVGAIFYLFVAVVEDRRAAYRRLERDYETTYAADRAKNEFIAILAHELRNPLAPIVSSLELLKLEPQTPEALGTIRNIETHTEMIRRLLDDLLDTARLSQKKFKLQKELLSVRDLIDQSAASVADMVQAKGHDLKISAPTEDISLIADPVRIKQVVINLLNNACKYTPHGGKITFAVERAGDELCIQVTDNGIGIEERMLTHIFEPFKQIETTGSTGAGLGIGLFLTKRLTEMHGGRIEASSKGLGRGSTFTVTIPISNQLSMPGTEERRESARALRTARVLIVDDNESAANVLQKLLKHKGHHVHVAYSGPQALSEVQAFKPEIVLLDLGMPDMDGYETARHIRTRSEKTKIVALSGYGQETDRLRTKQAGFDHHFVKPVNADQIIAYIGSTQATFA